MALTNADAFAAAVITAMGSPAEFTSAPLSKSACRHAAAVAYQKYLDDDSVERGRISAQRFGFIALQVADNEVMGRLHQLQHFGWSAAALRDTFRAAIEATFPTYTG